MWPLSFFVFVPKWDNINGYLPYRYFISDYLWNGHLPLWSPFQRLGYPGYSDLQSGCWSPITWVIMLFGKYTIGSLIVELLSYYVIAGLGMYRLGIFFFNNSKTSFIIGLCYALSGFMVGSSQLMVFLIGVAWLPWVIYALLKFFKNLKIKHAALTALFLALCTSAVSPAYTIVLAYIFVFIFGYFLLKHKSNKANLKKIVVGGGVMLVLTVLMLLPYINSFLEFSPYFNRIDKLEYSGFLLSNPFTLVDYISFIFPYSVISVTDIFSQTDLSLRNGYFGFIALIFFIIALFNTKTKNYKTLLLVFIGALILAAGSDTFIYKWVYNLPGFGIFRHPSFFRTYAIFSALLFAGYALNNSINENKLSKNQKFIFLGAIIFTGIVAFYTFFKSSFSEIGENITHVLHHQEFSNNSIYTHLLINALLILILIGFVVLIHKVFKQSLFLSLAIFVILDLGIQTTLSAPTTIHFNFSYQELAAYFDDLPNEINQKDNYTPLKKLDETQELKKTKILWRNLSTFNKTLTCVGENPMRFKSFDDAEASGDLARCIENPIIYFPSKIYHEGDSLQQGLIWGAEHYNDFTPESVQLDAVKVGYNEFSAKISNTSNQNQWLILNQNYHHLWKAKYLGNKLKISKLNNLVMGVEIPKNSEGKIEFIFESPKSVYFFVISLLAYLSVIVYLSISKKPTIFAKN